MTDLTITRGRDMELYLDDEPLCGVTHFKAQSRYQHHEVYEYLSAQPVAKLKGGESHQLELTVLSLFGGAIPGDRSFSIRVVDGAEEYVYEDCVVTGYERDIRGDKPVTDGYTLKADRMTKRRNDNAR